MSYCNYWQFRKRRTGWGEGLETANEKLVFPKGVSLKKETTVKGRGGLPAQQLKANRKQLNSFFWVLYLSRQSFPHFLFLFLSLHFLICWLFLFFLLISFFTMFVSGLESRPSAGWEAPLISYPFVVFKLWSLGTVSWYKEALAASNWLHSPGCLWVYHPPASALQVSRQPCDPPHLDGSYSTQMSRLHSELG